MNAGIVRLQVYVLAMILASGCQNEILLMPDSVISNEAAEYPYTRMLDGSWRWYWKGVDESENVFYYFDSPVNVKKVVVQRWSSFLDRVYVFNSEWSLSTDGGAKASLIYADDGGFDLTTFPLDFKTSVVAFTFINTGHVPYVARAEVYGCYDTSNPTNVPTTQAPTIWPSAFPTTSPTWQPTTTFPSHTPSIMPTTSPTVSPTIVLSSEAPSIIPTTSPTLAPTTVLSSEAPSSMPTISPTLTPTTSAFPSSSPSTLPTKPPSIVPSISPTVGPTLLSEDGFKLVLRRNHLVISAGVVILCGALLMLLRRCRKKKELLNILEIAEANARFPNRTKDKIEDYEGEGNMISISKLEPAAESFC